MSSAAFLHVQFHLCIIGKDHLHTGPPAIMWKIRSCIKNDPVSSHNTAKIKLHSAFLVIDNTPGTIGPLAMAMVHAHAINGILSQESRFPSCLHICSGMGITVLDIMLVIDIYCKIPVRSQLKWPCNSGRD